jgi:hypothetical protein
MNQAQKLVLMDPYVQPLDPAAPLGSVRTPPTEDYARG